MRFLFGGFFLGGGGCVYAGNARGNAGRWLTSEAVEEEDTGVKNIISNDIKKRKEKKEKKRKRQK